MLNSDAKVITVARLQYLDFSPDYQIFVRPDDGSKSFSGIVYDYKEAPERFYHLDASNPYLNSESTGFME